MLHYLLQCRRCRENVWTSNKFGTFCDTCIGRRKASNVGTDRMDSVMTNHMVYHGKDGEN